MGDEAVVHFGRDSEVAEIFQIPRHDSMFARARFSEKCEGLVVLSPVVVDKYSVSKVAIVVQERLEHGSIAFGVDANVEVIVLRGMVVVAGYTERAAANDVGEDLRGAGDEVFGGVQGGVYGEGAMGVVKRVVGDRRGVDIKFEVGVVERVERHAEHGDEAVSVVVACVWDEVILGEVDGADLAISVRCAGLGGDGDAR